MRISFDALPILPTPHDDEHPTGCSHESTRQQADRAANAK
jgi:hypothetical protein